MRPNGLGAAVLAAGVLSGCASAPPASAPTVTVTAPGNGSTITVTATETKNQPPTSIASSAPLSTNSMTAPSLAAASSSTDSSTAKLGSAAFTYSSGLAIKVSAPSPYTPSRESMNGGSFKMFLVFQITVINGTKDTFNPGVMQTSLQSGDVAGSDVIDMGNGIGMPPQTLLLPGRSVTYKVAFGVKDAKNLVLQVTPDFQSKPALFTS